MSTITQALTYSWLDPAYSTPQDSNIYWVIIKNKVSNKQEVTQVNYNHNLNLWEILPNESVIAWMPLESFLPTNPFLKKDLKEE